MSKNWNVNCNAKFAGASDEGAATRGNTERGEAVARGQQREHGNRARAEQL